MVQILNLFTKQRVTNVENKPVVIKEGKMGDKLGDWDCRFFEAYV